MIEIIVLFMILSLFAACFFSPLGGGMQSFLKSDASEGCASVSPSTEAGKQVQGENFSFLAHLKNEIEAELFPRPTCSVLQRHYDARVAAEVESRLALMTE